MDNVNIDYWIDYFKRKLGYMTIDDAVICKGETIEKLISWLTEQKRQRLLLDDDRK